MSIKRLAINAMLMAMAIVLSIVESFIPVFVPGVKLGLANVIILIMFYEFSIKEAFIVNVLRILLVGLLRGTFLSPTLEINTFLLFLFNSSIKPIFDIFVVTILE